MTTTRSRHTVVRIMGGLGNQLFQVAHALDLRATGMSVAVDTSWYRRRPGLDTPRALEVDPALANLRIVRLPSLVWSPRLRLAQAEGAEPTRPTRVPFPALVYGYWQSWAAVDRVHLPMNQMLDAMQNVHHVVPLSDRDYVALHVRLGDYLTSRASKFHGVTDPVQQMRVALEMAERVGARRIRVFTDTIAALPAQLATEPIIDIDDSSSALQVLVRMSSAKGIVMSNSSLSWWAAARLTWVATTPAPVAAPTPWLRSASPLDRELLAPHWSSYSRGLLDS